MNQTRKRKARPDTERRICLLPPQELKVELTGRGPKLTTELRWKPPKKNAEAVGGYHVDRVTWWPGVAPVERRLTEKPVRECTFRDQTTVADQINEYRVRAVNRHFPEVLGPASFPAAVYGFAFMRYAEMVEELRALAEANPDICRLVDAGPASGQGLRVWCMVLGTDTSDYPDRPGVFYAGNPHGSEVEGGDACMGVIRELVRRYRAHEATVVDLLENVQVRIIPVHNPHGRQASERGAPLGVRKNHAGRPLSPPLDPLEITDYWRWDNTPGTDPNRNFDAGWEDTGEPNDPSGCTYPGPRAASAPETRAVVRMARAFRPQISANFHGPCGYPLLPGTWADGREPVDRELHYEVGREFALLSAPLFTSEVAAISAQPTSLKGGVAQTWFYHEFYGAHLLPEGFYEQVPYDSRLICVHGSDSIPELTQGNLQALLAMGQRVRGAGITVRVRDLKGKPLQATVEVEGHMDPHCSPQLTDRRHGAYRRILSPGRYALRVSREGYKSQELQVRVVPEATTAVEVRLERAGRGSEQQ